jgi:hypothetical protein
MLNRTPVWKTVAIAVGTAATVLGVVALIVWLTVARDRVTPPAPTPTRVAPSSTASIAQTATLQNTNTAIPPDAALGVVEDYTAGALIIVIKPIQGKVDQIIVPENLQVSWEDGRRASPREIARGQTIYAEGALDSLGRLVASAITIIDAGAAATATPMVSPTPGETATPQVPQSAWLAEYFANVTLTGSPVLVRQDRDIDFQWGTGSPGPAVPADRFSARWRGYWSFDTARYTLVAYSDDGVRVWVDGQRIIDNWVDQAPAIASGEVYLRSGMHLVEVEYFDNREGAQIRVYWEKQGSFANWKGEYFDNPRLEGEPALVRNDEDINFNWGTGAPSPQIPADNFTARWTQTVSVAEGAYRFKARADDGVRVFVDDRLIIDAWLPNVEQTFVGYVWLPQGNHSVRIEYLELGGAASVQVWREEITSFTGWRGEYYANPDLADNPLFVRDDEQISANWGDGSPGYGVPADSFSIRWSRRLTLEAGRHNFWAYADDGVRVYVNGRLVIDAWQDSSAERYDGTIDLDAGEHRIVVEYYEGQGQAVIQFGWEKSLPSTATPTATPTATVTTAPPTATATPTITLTPAPPTATPTETVTPTG